MQGMQRHIGRLEHEINKYKCEFTVGREISHRLTGIGGRGVPDIVSKAKDKKHLAALMEENEEIKLQVRAALRWIIRFVLS